MTPFGDRIANFRASSPKLLFNLENPFLKELARLGKSRYDRKLLEFWRVTDNFRYSPQGIYGEQNASPLNRS
jgi:hypothetical protein